MKKLLYFLAAAAMVLACVKDAESSDDNNGGNNNNPSGPDNPPVEDVQVSKIEVEPTFSLAINAGEKLIPVTLTPPEAKVNEHIKVECDQEGVLNWSPKADGISIKPIGLGQAVFTLSPKKGMADFKKVTVTVTDKPAEPVSIKITNTGEGFMGGELMLNEGDTYSLKATVKDDKGGTDLSSALTWEVVQGGDYLSIDTKGKITSKAISGAEGKIAKVKVTVTSTAESANPLTDEVIVDIAAIAKITIDRSGSNFQSGSTFALTAGKYFSLAAKVYNSREQVLTKDITWTKTSGDANVTVSNAGTVSASDAATGYATIQAKVKDKPSLIDQVTVNITPQPASISLTLTSGTYYSTYNSEYYVKKGGIVHFKATVSPASADQSVKVTLVKTISENTGEATVEQSKLTGGGVDVKFTAVSSGQATFRMTVSSGSKSSVNQSILLHVDDYVASDIKPGDYVYYSSSSKTFKSVDCGIRRSSFLTAGKAYEATDGSRVDSPRTPGTLSGYEYIGVLASTEIPSADDFLKLSLLSQCRNGNSATNLYEYNTFRRSNLPGLYNNSGVHGLVICKNESPAGGMYFQSKVETIAQTDDKNGGIYQYQLKNVVALSLDEEDAGYGTFVEYGLLNYLLLRFYNSKLNHFNDFNVQPVNYVVTYSSSSSVPTMTSGTGKRSTGWFLPSRGEWVLVRPNLSVIQESLKNSSSDGLASGTGFWTPCEKNEKQALYYRSSSSTFSTTGKNSSNSGYQCYVRPMLYL